MFPFRYSSIFKSRWMALLFAASILWTALDVAGKPAAKSGDGNAAAAADSTGAPASSAEMNQAEAILQKLGS